MRVKLLFLVFFVGLGASTTPRTPIPPSKDPWYRPPSRFESAAPGTVFKVRQAPGNLTDMFNCSAVYNILYRTTDSQYLPTWAVTTLYIPLKSGHSPRSATTQGQGDAAPSPPFLTWLHPYDSNSLDSSPSYLFYDASTPFVQDLRTALSRGWHVSVPDYEGPKASFTAGVMSGHAVLDSVRAVQRARLPSIDDRNPAAIWGYSGGGLAAGWAAELQASYAPDLELAGVAMGSPVVNVTDVLYRVNNTPLAGLIPPALLGLTSQYPDAQKFLISHLKPGPTNDAFLAARNVSWTQAIQTFSGQDIATTYFINGLADVFAPEMRLAWGRDSCMGYHGVPWMMPVYVYQAAHDELASVDDTAALVARYCGVGANIFFERNQVGGHLEELVAGAPGAVRWLASVFDGTYSQKYPSTGCTIVDV
ncbi:lipase [Podospora didyma]|uniref:Lipase n=1 Tax=Podospora didyma TaxID=330526 RepID=A0AAE0KDS7_9PEZI|nr:lipase [Podospora didyma]